MALAVRPGLRNGGVVVCLGVAFPAFAVVVKNARGAGPMIFCGVRLI